MHKLIFTFSIVILSYVNCDSQSFSICSHNHYGEVESYGASENFENNKEAIVYIENLLKTVKLPMNFQIRQCNSKSCKNNAYATMDEFGTRFIVYDNEWFRQIDIDSTKNKSLTILAHELGHHLSAHTLFLNEETYSDAINICDKRSKNYDKTKCENAYKSDYLNYLDKSRKQELQADRFAGYIMSKFGLSLDTIKKSYSTIMKEYDDSESTHPTLSKRLKSLENGFNLAIQKNKKIDLFEIKGNPTSIEVTDPNLKNQIENQKETSFIVSNLKKNIVDNPRKKLDNNTALEISSILTSKTDQSILQKINHYLGQNNYKGGKKHFKNSEVFEYFNYSVNLRYNNKVFYNCHPAYHIKNGILKVLLFNEEKPKVVYKSIATKDKISFREIELIMIEIYDNGLNQAITKYEEGTNDNK